METKFIHMNQIQKRHISTNCIFLGKPTLLALRKKKNERKVLAVTQRIFSKINVDLNKPIWGIWL